jgi:hypothetical protein
LRRTGRGLSGKSEFCDPLTKDAADGGGTGDPIIADTVCPKKKHLNTSTNTSTNTSANTKANQLLPEEPMSAKRILAF